MEKEENPHHKLIEENHVKACLKADKGCEAELSSWSIEDFTQKGDNYATIVTSVKVSYIVKGKPDNVSYVVKINPGNGLESFKTFVEAVFVKEGRFYQDIVPLVNEVLDNAGLDLLRVPKWFYTSPEVGKELIFLEDLRPKGFKMFDRKKGMDVPHTLLVLNELARLHSASAIMHEKQSLKDLADKYSFLKVDWYNYAKDSEESMKEMLGASLNTASDMLHKITGYEKAEKWVNQCKIDVMTIMKKHLDYEDPFVSICHGDCWNNNMLFRYDAEGNPTEVMLVDLQISRVASPATDLTYFISTSLTGDVRTSNEKHFLSSYYNNYSTVMKAVGKELPFTHQELLSEFKKKLEFGFIFGIMTVMIMVSSKEEIPDVHVDIKEEDIPKLMEEWKEVSMKAMSHNPLFKPRFLALFDYMEDHGVF